MVLHLVLMPHILVIVCELFSLINDLSVAEFSRLELHVYCAVKSQEHLWFVVLALALPEPM